MASFMDMALEEARAAGAARRGAGRLRHRARRRGDRAGRQPHARRPRPDRACRNAGDPQRRAPRSAPSGSTDCDLYVTLEPCAMCAGGDVVRAHPPALLRRRRSQGRRGRERRAVLRLADLPSPAGGLWRHCGSRGGGAAARIFFAAAGDAHASKRAELLLHFVLDRLGGAQDRARLEKSSVRKIPTFGRIIRSGAACRSFAAMMACP